jgi:hypothetical protein
MIETIADDAAGCGRIRVVDMPTVRSFLVRNDDSGQTVKLASESWDGRSRLEVTFLGVVDLQVSWPDYPTPAQLDGIGISDVSADGLEKISYRVAEDAGFFAFWCREFFATTTRGD